MMEENDLPKGWTVKTLGDICNNVSRRFDFNSKSKVIFINTGDVLNGRFLHKSFSDKKGLPGQAKKAIKKGDILYSEIRPKNKRFAIVDFEAGDYVVSTKLMVIEHNDLVRLDFLFTLLSSNKQIQIFNEIAESRSGTFPQITFDSISYLKILLPPLPEQKAIASILTSFDDKIELLQAQNETLETIAQTIFKEWFGKYQVGDELPEGWRVENLGNVSLLSAGGDKPINVSLTSNEINNIPIYSNGITADGLYGYTDTPKVTEECITVSARGTIGFVCLRTKPFVPIVRLVTVIPKKNCLTSKYLFFWLKNANIDGTGTTQQQLTVPDFKRTEIIIPRFELINKFTTVVDSFYDKIEVNNSQIQILQQTRDTLLPKLMSGKLRVEQFKD